MEYSPIALPSSMLQGADPVPSVISLCLGALDVISRDAVARPDTIGIGQLNVIVSEAKDLNHDVAKPVS